MTLDIQPRPLEGDSLSLEPLGEAHRAGMARALDQDPAGWTQMVMPGHGEHFGAWWTNCLREMAGAGRLAYAIRFKATAEIVGTTSFVSFRPQYRGVLIGATFITPSARGGAVNAEAKLLMLDEAFGLGALRIEFLVAGNNVQSQDALARFGFIREGVLRRDWIGWTGEVHDTVVYAVTDEDWPAVRAILRHKVGSP